MRPFFLAGLVLLVLLAGGCDPRLLGRSCAELANGIYFSGDTAYVSSYDSGGIVLLWNVDLANNELSDLRYVRYVNTPPEDAEARATWEYTSREYALRRTWLNKGVAEGNHWKDFRASDGTTYSVTSRGEVLQIDMTRNGITKTVLGKEADRDITDYSAEITMVEPGKLYILVGRHKYSPERPDGRRITAKGAVLYVADPKTGEVMKEISLWAEAIASVGDSLAQAPNGLVYTFSSSSPDLLVIDPGEDKLIGKITLCR